MKHISRRDFLKIAGVGTIGSVLACSCASRPSSVPTSTVIPLSSMEVPMKTETTTLTILLPDSVAYICGCKPDTHNPGGGGDSSLFIGNYCKKSERFLLHWDLSGLSSELKRLFRSERERPQIWGCVGGYAAHTPPNLGTIPSKTVEPLKISKAIMELYCVEIYGTPSGRIIFSPLNSDWGKTVAYNTQPENDVNEQVSTDWPTKEHWLEVDITGIVNQWLVAPEKNHGLIGYAVDVSEETCSAVFASVQMSEGLRPKLTIT
jgi:hypothetical protein